MREPPSVDAPHSWATNQELPSRGTSDRLCRRFPQEHCSISPVANMHKCQTPLEAIQIEPDLSF